MDKLIRVLVVDDSAYVRKVIKRILSRSPFIEVVGMAHDGEEALELVETLKPDVVTLDLIMPRRNGLSFLREQMARCPISVIVVSIASESNEQVLEALSCGAVDFIHKPTSLATDKIFDMSSELLAKVKTSAQIKPTHLQTLLNSAAYKKSDGKGSSALAQTSGNGIGNGKISCSPANGSKRLIDVVTLGISTGGPQALRFLIPQLPGDFPVPIVMVLHMPVGYTKMYAEKLNEVSALTVLEASEGDELRAGMVYLAPAGRHLKLIRHKEGQIITHLDINPSNTLHRPSVDVLFQSVAEIFGKRALGIVMTGMGSDGKQGAAWIKSQGGLIFTEAEETCIVYGMPLSVVEAGLSDKSVPLDKMGQRILETVCNLQV